MPTTSKRSRKSAVLVFLGILLCLCVVFLPRLWQRVSPEVATVAPQFSSRVRVDEMGPRTSPRLENAGKNTSVGAEAEGHAGVIQEMPAGDNIYAAPGTPTLASAVVSGVVGSSAVAVIDLERLLAEYQSRSDPRQQRSNALQNIKRMVTARAAAHNFGLVFDLSAKSPSGARFVVATNGVPDITQEILQEFSP